jgi:hypothetical protein
MAPPSVASKILEFASNVGAYLRAWNRPPQGAIKADWVAVRKVIAKEPTQGSWRPETHT